MQLASVIPSDSTAVPEELKIDNPRALARTSSNASFASKLSLSSTWISDLNPPLINLFILSVRPIR